MGKDLIIYLACFSHNVSQKKCWQFCSLNKMWWSSFQLFCSSALKPTSRTHISLIFLSICSFTFILIYCILWLLIICYMCLFVSVFFIVYIYCYCSLLSFSLCYIHLTSSEYDIPVWSSLNRLALMRKEKSVEYYLVLFTTGVNLCHREEQVMITLV